MNKFEEIEELKMRSKDKGLDLSEEDIRTTLKHINKSIEGLSIEDRIRKLAKMLKEEDSKNE